jgi:hypothetical protein
MRVNQEKLKGWKSCIFEVEAGKSVFYSQNYFIKKTYPSLDLIHVYTIPNTNGYRPEKGGRHDTQHNDTQHNNKYDATISIIISKTPHSV